MQKLNTIDGATLMTQPFTPMPFVVESLLSQGLHLLAGLPKVGKSWLALWLSVQVAGVSKSTVKRCVDSLTEKGCIRTERTHRQAKDGSLLNGSLMYTLNSPQEMLDRFYERQLAKLEQTSERQRTAGKLQACSAL